MNLNQQILIFRTCLGILVTLKGIVRDNPSLNQKTADNLEVLAKNVHQEVNRLYEQESKK